MIRYPIDFFGEATATPGMDTFWHANSGQEALTCAIPPEFEGKGGALSPEDYFCQALTHCFIATFKVYAHHSRAKFDKVETRAKLTVDLNDEKRPVMKTFFIQIRITGADQPERIKAIAERALKSGFILNSVKTEIQHSLEITA